MASGSFLLQVGKSQFLCRFVTLQPAQAAQTLPGTGIGLLLKAITSESQKIQIRDNPRDIILKA